MTIDKQQFRNFLGQFAAGVTIITTVGRDGTSYGLTATAFTSVSLEPPLILVCVDKRSDSYPHLMLADAFSVSFLSSAQQGLSNRFAKSGIDKFDGTPTQVGVNGVPHIVDALAHLDCRVHERVDAGDHTIFLGLVEGGVVGSGEPLLYFRGAYRQLAETP